MINYFFGFLYLISSILLYQFFGIALTKNDKSEFSYSFLIGFVVYSFFVAIVGITVQIVNLSWYLFFAYMIILWILILIFIFYNFKIHKISISKAVIIQYIKEYWFIYLGSFLILILALSHIDIIWANGFTDDGYYLNKIATLPYIENPFRTDPVTGFSESGNFTYYLNTFELEASFYLYLIKIPVTLFARFFMAYLNYFILLNVMHAFIYKLMSYKNKISPNILQYILLPLFIIFIMNSKYFLKSEEYWTISAAAYYGSALVRVGCLFFCLTPLLDTFITKNLSKEQIVITFMNCVVMISKSTIAAPILFTLAIGFLVFYYFSKIKIISLSIFVLFILVGFILPNNIKINTYIIEILMNNFTKPFIIISLIIIFIISLKNKVYKNLLVVLLISSLLIFVPELNDTFETISNYTFVADRTVYSYTLYIMIVGLSSGIVYLFSLMKSNKTLPFLGIFATVFSLLFIFVNNINNVYFIDSAKTYYRNKYIIPQSTIYLGEKIEEYYKDTNVQPIVMMQPGLTLNGQTHFTGSIIRSFAPHALSVVGGIRIHKEYNNKNSIFDGFSLSDLDTFTAFFLNPSEDSLYALEKMNSTYPFNVIIGQNFTEFQENLLNQIGYFKYADVSDNNQSIIYNIFVK